jgi:hypothetical protein
MAEFIPTGIGGLGTRGVPRKAGDKPAGRSYERHELLPPPKPSRNFIPSQEAIDALLERALAALRRGMIWDRGSIINLVL